MSDQSRDHADSGQWSFCFDQLDEASSEALARDIASLLQRGDVLALDGDLGLGKSTFARALLRALGGDPYLEVPSPTFTLVQAYEFDALDASHFDLYRISDFEELYEIGLEDSWQQGCALIEWPDRAEDLLPSSCLWLHFENGMDDQSRKLTLEASQGWGERLGLVCAKRALMMQVGLGAALRTPIPGDLSPRSYDRIESFAGNEGGNIAAPAILMHMPEREPGPKLADGRLYDRVAHRVTHIAPMISISEGLKQLGQRVPDLLGWDRANGLAIWEDFGAETLATGPDAPIEARYLAVMDALAALHARKVPEAFVGDGGTHILNRYDEAAMRVELDVFLDWYWLYRHGAKPDGPTRLHYHSLWDEPLARLQTAQQGLVLRDVQDPNCFWLKDRQGDAAQGAIGFIDFQDCLIGPVAYDLASVCMDARVTIPHALERVLIAHYIQQSGMDAQDQDAFEEAYALCAIQRISKNLGAFARAALSLRREDYLAHMPRSLGYLDRALQHPTARDLRTFYCENDLLA